MPSPRCSPLFLFLAEHFGTPSQPNDRGAIRTIAHGLATGELVYDYVAGDYVRSDGVGKVDRAEVAEATR